MAKYRRLNEWAERDQRHFDEQRALPPRVPGTEPLAARVVSGALATFATALKLVTVPAMFAWTVVLVAQHTVRSLILAFAVFLLACFSAATTVMIAQTRHRRGLNLLTGLAPRVRSGSD